VGFALPSGASVASAAKSSPTINPPAECAESGSCERATGGWAAGRVAEAGKASHTSFRFSRVLDAGSFCESWLWLGVCLYMDPCHSASFDSCYGGPPIVGGSWPHPLRDRKGPCSAP
jgi:hypothetical protein